MATAFHYACCADKSDLCILLQFGNIRNSAITHCAFNFIKAFEILALPWSIVALARRMLIMASIISSNLDMIASSILLAFGYLEIIMEVEFSKFVPLNS